MTLFCNMLFSGDSFTQLVTEEFLIRQNRSDELSFKERAQFRGVPLLRFSSGLVRQGSFELDQFVAGELVIHPGGPLLLKCFHKRLSTGSAIFCARKKVAT